MSGRALALAFLAAGVLGAAAWTWARGDARAAPSEPVRGAGRAGRTATIEAPTAPRRTTPPSVLEQTTGQLEAERLAAFDAALGDGYQRCAPELEGYVPEVLAELERDWRALKPDLRPSWHAWSALYGVVLDEELVRRCQATFARAVCAEVAASWEACAQPFAGTLAQGDACAVDGQCGSATCRLDRCAPRDECETRADCGPSMFCVAGKLGSNTCIPAPLEGEPCLLGARCAEDHWCGDDSRCRAFRHVGDGEPCDRRSDRCAEYSWCLDGSCVDLRAINEALGPLRDHEIGPPPCSCRNSRDGMACVDGHDGPACVPVRYAEVGESCDDNSVRCRGLMRTTFCRDSTCALAGGPGDSCSASEECRDELRCANERCTSPAGPGDGCDSHDACAFGLVCIFDGDGADDGGDLVGACDLPRRR